MEFLARSKTFAFAFGVLLVGILAVPDYYTGFQFSFTLFYLIPVALVARYCDVKAAVAISAISAATWQIVNRIAGEEFSNPLIPYWNAMAHFSLYVTVALLAARLGESLQRERELRRTDFLTGTLNSRGFYELAEAEIARARENRRPFTVSLVDLDHLSLAGEQPGHVAHGDLMVTVSGVARQNLRAQDVLARLGPDEYGILMPETDMDTAREILDKLTARLLEEIKTNGWPVSLSAGALTCVDVPVSVDEMIGMVDKVVQAARKAGKNQFVHHVLRTQLVSLPA